MVRRGESTTAAFGHRLGRGRDATASMTSKASPPAVRSVRDSSDRFLEADEGSIMGYLQQLRDITGKSSMATRSVPYSVHYLVALGWVINTALIR